MTKAAQSPDFRRVLVPYDGSEGADGALTQALALGRAGSAIDILHVIDETAVLAASAGAMTAFDASGPLAALDESASALMQAARERCRSNGVEPTTTVLHGRPVPAIVATAEKSASDLIIMGTHARAGLPRLFLGSTTEGVLRLGTAPVLVVRAPAHAATAASFHTLLVAVDHSEPADAAAIFAGRLARAAGSSCFFCHAIDTEWIHAKAASVGFDPHQHVNELRSLGHVIVAHAQKLAHLAESASTGIVVENTPVKGILEAAQRVGADAIVIGSHGRRGLQRLVLGSVAEQLARNSPVPVFVVRDQRWTAPAVNDYRLDGSHNRSLMEIELPSSW